MLFTVDRIFSEHISLYTCTSHLEMLDIPGVKEVSKQTARRTATLWVVEWLSLLVSVQCDVRHQTWTMYFAHSSFLLTCPNLLVTCHQNMLVEASNLKVSTSGPQT